MAPQVIPYLPQPHWRLGPLTIYAFGITSCLSILVSYALVLSRAERHGLTRNQAGTLFITILLSALLTGFLWTGGSGESSTGAAIGSMAAFLYCRRRAPMRPALDLIALAFAGAYPLARLGCFLAHDHLGPFTTSRLGVQFPGGTRFDLGLLYFLAASLSALGALAISRAPLPSGFLCAWVAFTFGLTKLALLPLSNPGRFDWLLGLGLVAWGFFVAYRWWRVPPAAA